MHRREKDRSNKASMRATETSKQTVHRQQKNREHMARMRATKKGSNVWTAGSSMITLNQLDEIPEHQRVSVRVKINDMQKVGSKSKQDVQVADSTGKATVTLWEPNTNSLQETKSYQLNRLEVRTYMGKKHLSFPSTTSIDEISDIDDVIDCTTSSDDDEDQFPYLASRIWRLPVQQKCQAIHKPNWNL